MKRLVLPGGSYGEAWPGDKYIALVGHQVKTHQGDLAIPPNVETLLYLRGNGRGSFAGVNHADHAWEYDGAWHDRGPACGVSPVIYPHIGPLLINDRCQHGTQGFRFVSDRVYTGDETYNGSATTGLAEWTQLGSVTIGQSYVANDAATVRYQGVRRILEPGHCRFIRFNREGSQLAVAAWKMQEHCTVLLWFNEAEIAGLPLEVAPIPGTPVPNPGTPMSTPNRKAVVEDVNRQHPHLLLENSVASCTRFRQLVAQRLHAEDANWGELTKEPHENQGPDGRAVDALIYRATQQVVDIISSAGDGPAKRGKPAWTHQSKRPDNHWIAPDDVPPPPPPVEPPPSGLTLEQRVARLEAWAGGFR